MKSWLAAGLLIAASLPALVAQPAAARSWMEQNAQSGSENGEISGFSAASPGIAAQARFRGQSGWENHPENEYPGPAYGTRYRR